MPGIVIGEVSSTHNPVLPFFYQENGVMKDPASIRWELFSASVSPIAFGTINLITNKVRTGYFACPIDPTALNLDLGSYELAFYYKPTATSSEQETSYFLEVLDERDFRSSRKFVGYARSNASVFSGYELRDVQKAIHAASKEVERITKRFFFPLFQDHAYSEICSSATLFLNAPIIGVERMRIETYGLVLGSIADYDIDLTGVGIYNRHLSGLISPDDRDNPKITYVGVGTSTTIYGTAVFPEGVKNIIVSGVFGYTEPDGGPFGVVPEPLIEVVTALAYQRLVDPLRQDPFTSRAASIKSAKTRDQSISFDTSKSASMAMTGDDRLDDILMEYARPFFVGVA